MRQMTKEEVRLFMESRRVFYFTRDEHPEVDVGFMDAEGDVALWLRRPDFHVQGTVKEGFHCTAYFGVVLIAGAKDDPQSHCPEWRFLELFPRNSARDRPRIRLDSTRDTPVLRVGDAMDPQWRNEAAKHTVRWISLVTASPRGIQKNKVRPADDDVLYWSLQEVSRQLWVECRANTVVEHAAYVKKTGTGWLNVVESHLRQLADRSMDYPGKLAALNATREAELNRLKATFDVESVLGAYNLSPEVMAYVKTHFVARDKPGMLCGHGNEVPDPRCGCGT